MFENNTGIVIAATIPIAPNVIKISGNVKAVLFISSPLNSQLLILCWCFHLLSIVDFNFYINIKNNPTVKAL